MSKRGKSSPLTANHNNLTQILIDHGLAALGDAYVNLVYSLALSQRNGKPTGEKVKGTILAEALRKATLRQYLPSKMDSHAMADAAEALMVYVWLNGQITIAETTQILEKAENPIEGFAQLLKTIKARVTFP
jgi:hypothetical protein